MLYKCFDYDLILKTSGFLQQKQEVEMAKKRYIETKLQLYYYSLSAGEKLNFLLRADIKPGTWRANYVITKTKASFNPKKPTRKKINDELARRIAKATKRACTIQDVFDHFAPQ